MADPTVVRRLSQRYSFLPEELLTIFVDGYIESGDVELALADMRAAPAYEKYYPGNRRTDGTLRFSEGEYTSYREFVRGTIASINVNPDLFSEQFVRLVEGDVSVDEFAGRVDAIYERVISQAPAIRQAYAAQFGIQLTDSAILAGALDPGVGRQILNRQISIAEVSGEAALRGFGLTFDFAAAANDPRLVSGEELVQAGLTREGAQEVFGQAALNLPVLNVLARRHADPDDDFDINEFLTAAIFDDPEQRRRIRQLVAAEQSLFTTGSFQQTAGGVTGVLAR